MDSSGSSKSLLFKAKAAAVEYERMADNGLIGSVADACMDEAKLYPCSPLLRTLRSWLTRVWLSHD